MSEPTFADVGLLGKLKQDVGAPIKQFFTGKPVAERFAPDLQQADAIQDPSQRAQALMAVRQQMRTAGFGVEDTSPVLKPRFDRALFDIRARGPEGETEALNIERTLGRVGPTRPSSVTQVLRFPEQHAGDVQRTQKEQNRAILGGMKVEQFQKLGPLEVEAESALGGQRRSAAGASEAAAGASGARQKLYEAQTGQVGQPKPGTTGGIKLTPTDREHLAEGDARIGQIDRLSQLPVEQFVGPVAGRLGAARQAVPGMGISNEEAQFRAEAEAFFYDMVKYYTGAQMSVQELERRKAQLPTPNDKPNVFRQKLDATRRNIAELQAQRRAQLGGQGGTTPEAPTEGTTPEGFKWRVVK